MTPKFIQKSTQMTPKCIQIDPDDRIECGDYMLLLRPQLPEGDFAANVVE